MTDGFATQSRNKTLDTNIIVIDGLPGLGKSTTAQWLELQLQRNQINARWLQEAEVPHPLWWYEQWNGTRYLPPDYDHIPMATFIETSLERWADFAAFAGASGTVYVVESAFSMNAVSMFLMGDARPAVLLDYARQVQTIVSDLNPILIYFYPADVTAALYRICAKRGPAFENELVRNMERFPYLKRRGLKGLDGVAVLWQAICEVTNVLFDEYTIRKLDIGDLTDRLP